MTRVRIKYACGHTEDAWVGETSSAGIGAAAAALKQQACPACREIPTDEEGDLKGILTAAAGALEKAVRAFRCQPTQEATWDVLDAVRRYQAAWDDFQHEVNR